MTRDAFAIDGGIRIGGSFFWRRERGVFALGAADKMQFGA